MCCWGFSLGLLLLAKTGFRRWLKEPFHGGCPLYGGGYLNNPAPENEASSWAPGWLRRSNTPNISNYANCTVPGFFFCSCHRIISTASSPYTIHCIMSNHLQLNDAQRWGEESGSSQSSWNKVICTCTWRSQKSQYNDCWWAKWSKSAETWFFGMTLVNLWKQWNRLRVRSWSKTWVVTDVQPWMPWISNMFSNWGGRWWTYLKFIHGFLTSPKASSCEETWSVFSKPAPIGPDKRVQPPRVSSLLKPTERLGLWSSAEVRSGSGSMFFKCSREE